MRPLKEDWIDGKQRLREALGTLPNQTLTFIRSLFPILYWIPRYDASEWMIADAIAGLTVGIMVIPQGLAYAKLSGVPVEFGLYASLMGLVLYPFLGSCKDVTMGPTGVLSLLIGQLVAANASPNYSSVVFATSLAFFTGVFQAVIGLFRLGILIDFISLSVISGFTTGAGLSIAIGQLPGLLGIKGVNTNLASHIVLVDTLRNLKGTNMNAIIGITSLILILLIKAAKQTWGDRIRIVYFIGIARNGLVVILYTIIAYIWCRGMDPEHLPITILKTVPAGFHYINAPDFSTEILGAVIPAAVGTTLVAVIEHIAIAKHFGRLNGYRPDASQELIAMGFTNMLGSIFGAFPVTGSFSRSAVNASGGVKTPLSGVVTCVLLVLAIAWLTPLLYFMPSSALSAVIGSSVLDLLARPAFIKQLWSISFKDLAAFVVALVITLFVNIQAGILAAVGLSLLIVLYRVARPEMQLLLKDSELGIWTQSDDPRKDRHEHVLKPPPPGILVMRPMNTVTFPTVNHFGTMIESLIREETKYNGGNGAGRLWCEPTFAEMEAKAALDAENALIKSVLRCLVIDCCAITYMDATGVQMLMDVQRAASAFAGRPIEIHFARVISADVERIVRNFLEMSGQNEAYQGEYLDLDGSWRDVFERDGHKVSTNDACYRFFHRTVEEAVSFTNDTVELRLDETSTHHSWLKSGGGGH